MGEAYAILLWDSWGRGLNRNNPRLHTDADGNNSTLWGPGRWRDFPRLHEDADGKTSWQARGTDTPAVILRTRGILGADTELDADGRIPGGPLYRIINADRPIAPEDTEAPKLKPVFLPGDATADEMVERLRGDMVQNGRPLTRRDKSRVLEPSDDSDQSELYNRRCGQCEH